MSVAFIIPHMGREQLLIETLVSIQKLDANEFDVHVVVVTKNQSISKELLGFADILKIEFIMVDAKITISDQRNIGAKTLKTDLVAFIDADIYLASNWLKSMSGLLEQPNVVLASAIQKASDTPSELEKVRVALSNHVIDCEMEFLPGRNLLMTTSTFEKTGGFPSELVTCEDYVFTQNVSRYGKLLYSSNSEYIHLGEDREYWAMAKKEVWRGQSNLASIKGRTIPLNEVPSFIVPPMFTVGVLLSCLLAIFGWYLFSIVFLSGGLIILAAYTFRLYGRSKKSTNLLSIAGFYSLYFPARTLGTILGAIKTIQTGDR